MHYARMQNKTLKTHKHTQLILLQGCGDASEHLIMFHRFRDKRKMLCIWHACILIDCKLIHCIRKHSVSRLSGLQQSRPGIVYTVHLQFNRNAYIDMHRMQTPRRRTALCSNRTQLIQTPPNTSQHTQKHVHGTHLVVHISPFDFVVLVSVRTSKPQRQMQSGGGLAEANGTQRTTCENIGFPIAGSADDDGVRREEEGDGYSVVGLKMMHKMHSMPEKNSLNLL